MRYDLKLELYNTADLPEITVVIPTYKTDKGFLKECLKSLKNQSMRSKNISLEIILILNGNQNPYLSLLIDIVNEVFIEEKNVYIRVLYAYDKGVSNARNIGIECALGKYICFIDDDDWVSSHYLEDLYESIKNGSYPLATLYDYVDGKMIEDSYYNKQFVKLKSYGIISLRDIRSWFSLPVIKIFRKKDIGNYRFNTKLTNGEDGLFVFDVLNSKLNFSLTSDKAIYYRRVRSNSLVGKLKSKNLLKRLLHATYLSTLYFVHYFRYGCKYNIIFLGTRMLAPFKHVIK